MGSGMNREEAEECAKNMTYQDAIRNTFCAKGIRYKKATRIKLHELAEIADKLVPCKDCDRGFGSPVCPIQSQGWAINTDTFFCAWGERKE